MFSRFPMKNLRPLALVAALALPLTAADAPPNRLAKEKSPYLLQHARNPVDWFPWGDEAFAKAKKENKPVLLSIGYATCHWCHVMERESFVDPEIAKYLNEHFVAIKLDREERPDLDHVYMTAMQALEMGGGWPLNVFLTPDRQPFLGGTYFPPKEKDGQPGFGDVLRHVKKLWTEREKDIRANAAEITKELAKVMSPTAGAAARGAFTTADMSRTATELMKDYDAEHGGFGKAPKFPQALVLSLVLRHGVTTGDAAATQAVATTLERMAAGGLYDQIGDGFARYSVDERWLVPHFEKMLYDNAQLASLALDVHTATGNAKAAEIARGIFRYVLRDMTSPDGAFYSAEDADSEGHEGKFYTWTKAELEGLLTPEEAAVALAVWGVTEKGNFVDHSHPEPMKGQNVLSVVDPAAAAGKEALLESARKKLADARAKRPRPLRDDKVLASWNGLMLSALAKGAAVLGDDALRAAAVKNATFLRTHLWDAKTKTLAHRWREGETDRAQLSRSYAFALQGVLDLYQTTLDPQWLTWALELADTLVARFQDEGAGGFFQSADHPELILRAKEDYDDAEPSGNSAAIIALHQLAALTDQPKWREVAEKALRLFAPKFAESGAGLPLMLQAAANFSAEPFRVVVAGDPASADARALVRAAFSVYQPNKVVLGTAAPAEEFARTLPAREGKATAYVCTGRECQPPTHEGDAMRRTLAIKPKPAAR